MRAVFNDRDGTITEDIGYVHKIEDFKFIKNAVKGLKLLKDYKLFIVTNQSGIGRGHYTLKDFNNFNNHLINELNKNNIKIQKTYYCPHKQEENCSCRKPKIRFLKEAEEEYGIDLKKSYVIGDKKVDVELGRNANCSSILVLTGDGKKTRKEVKPDFTAKDLLEAAKWIIKNDKK